VKQPAQVIDTWSPRETAARALEPSVPVRRLPPGVFGDQLAGKPEEALEWAEEPAEDSA
jgi:hypothetical protein